MRNFFFNSLTLGRKSPRNFGILGGGVAPPFRIRRRSNWGGFEMRFKNFVAKCARAWDKTCRTSGMFETALPVPRLNDNNTGARPGCGGCQAAFDCGRQKPRRKHPPLLLEAAKPIRQDGNSGGSHFAGPADSERLFYYSGREPRAGGLLNLCKKPVRTGPGCPRFIL